MGSGQVLLSTVWMSTLDSLWCFISELGFDMVFLLEFDIRKVQAGGMTLTFPSTSTLMMPESKFATSNTSLRGCCSSSTRQLVLCTTSLWETEEEDSIVFVFKEL